jgi:hypothetical protein
MKEAEEKAKAKKVVIIPVGSVEEHGDHLPLCTDSLQPEYVALEVAKKTKCLVAPTLRYGVCNSTRNFPGTISIGFESLHKIIRDILEEFIRTVSQEFLYSAVTQDNRTWLRLDLRLRKPCGNMKRKPQTKDPESWSAQTTTSPMN